MKKSISILVLLAIFLTNCKDEPQVVKKVKSTEFSTTATSGSDFLAQRSPEAQIFRKNSDGYFNFTSSNGLMFAFPPNAFKNSAGTTVTGDVDIKITEYLSKTDMIFSGITTTSNDKLLESGGMFNIEVSQGGQPLELNANTYSVLIPANTPQDNGMRVFIGETSSTNGVTVNWVERTSSWVARDSFKDDSPYQLTLDFIGWCNLDKFYNESGGVKVRLKVPTGYNNTNSSAYIILEGNSVARLFGDSINQEFNSGAYRLPVGWKIKMLVVAVIDEELQYALIETTIVDNHLETITSLTPIKEEDLADTIKALL